MKQGKGAAAVGLVLASLSAATFVLTVAPSTSRAEQFVLFDALFTYTKMDADTGTPNKSHVYIRDRAGSSRPVYMVLNTQRPTNWMTPVDYRNGSVHIRTEVIDKPAGSEITQWTLCYIPVRGVPGGNGYGCTGSGTYREEGLYEQNVSMTSWWENASIDWTMGIQGMDLVMKDSDGGGGFTYLRPDSEKFFPTTMRITMIQVSAGSTYNPALVPGLDGGVPTIDSGAPRDGSGVVDPTPPDASRSDAGAAGAGGAQGSAGAGGSTAGAGQATGGSGGDGSGGTQGAGGAQGTAGTSQGTTGGAATTATTSGATTGSGTTTGAPPSGDAGGCSCSLAQSDRGSTLGYAGLAGLAVLGTGRRRRARRRR